MSGSGWRLSLACAGSATSLAMMACAVPSRAQAPVAAEKGLLGIRILQSYRSVLNKFGQPDGVYPAGQIVNMEMAVDANGSLTGGVRGPGDAAGGSMGLAGMGGGGGFGGRGGMPASGGMMMGGKMGGMMGGMPGMPGMGGGMMGGKMGGMMGGMTPGGMSGGMSGPPGMPGGMRPGMGGGMSGPPGMPGMGGGMLSGRGMPGSGVNGGGLFGGGTGTGGGGNTFAEAGGFIWVYYVPKKQLAYEFFFNKDGRVEGILERGKSGGFGTSRGIHLGMPVRSLYNVYGWPDSIEVQGPGLALNFNQRHHAYFSVLNNRVTGIAVFLRESQRVRFFDGATTGGTNLAGGMMGGRMGGMPGMPGMGGGMMGGKMGGMMGGMTPGGMSGMAGMAGRNKEAD